MKLKDAFRPNSMDELYGRLLLKKDLKTVPSQAIVFESMNKITKSKMRCNRCGQVSEEKLIRLPIGYHYCPHCIQMGRVRSDEKLYHLPQQDFEGASYLRWQGNLTTLQKDISERLIQFSHTHKNILVQAVTGAGKTEMIYPIINEALKKGKAVGLTSPRIDVCLELHRRLSRDFSCPIALLHGQGEAYTRTPLVIATTHQLLRFHAAFELLILDEVDAFPFTDNKMLTFALNKARTDTSRLVYLTATPTNELEKQVKCGQIKKLQLARRFHGFPLVLPQFIWQSKFYFKLKEQRATAFPLLIFVPKIKQGEELLQILKKAFPKEAIAFVASTSIDRLDSVEKFRKGEISILISTTILERGVTFPKVDVFVFHSHHHNFTSSSLIQIAGRVGRSTDRPGGKVYFFHQGKTKRMVEAYRNIKKMNQIGGFI